MERDSVIPYITIHPNYLTTFVRSDRPHFHSFQNENSKANLHRNNHHNYLSEQSTRKVKKAVNYMTLLSTNKNNYSKLNWKSLKFKLCFVTLTLSAKQFHTDNYIKSKMLNQFIIEAKQHWEISNYVWRQEKQQNGNIHLHILFDKFIPWYEIRAVWNRIQSKEGYIEQYRLEQKEFHKKGFQVRKDLLDHWSYKAQLKAYKYGCKTNWSNPNSTDIHSVRLIKNVGAYLVKYMTKGYLSNSVKISKRLLNYEKKYIKGTHSLSFNVMKYLRTKAQKGRLWSCSYNLTDITGANTEIDNSISNELMQLKKLRLVKTIDSEYYNIITASLQDLVKLKCTNLIYMFSEYIVEKFILTG
jgi:hypothetical protein